MAGLPSSRTRTGWPNGSFSWPPLGRHLHGRGSAVLAAPIAVRPTAKGEWTFAGYSNYSEIVKGGIGKGVAVTDQRDEVTAGMMSAWLVKALNQAMKKTLAEGPPLPNDTERITVVHRDGELGIVFDGKNQPVGPRVFRPISGGSGAPERGYELGDSDMAPKPPTFGTPRRSRGAPL
jgi:hypothetical protein